MAVKNDREKHPEKYFTGPGNHPKDRILIHPNAELPKAGLFVSLNGFAYLIKPGFEVDVPRPIREMLDTRIRTETLEDENGNRYRRDVPRVTYTLIKADITNILTPEPEPESAVPAGGFV